MELRPFLEAANLALVGSMSPLDLPVSWREMSGKAELRLSSQAWADPQGNQVKCAYLSGPRAEIINLMGYPVNVSEVPVMALEIILFGKIPRVAVIDLQPAAGWRTYSRAWLSQIQQELPDVSTWNSSLSPGGDLPEWAEPHFTPWCVYSRPQALEELNPLLSIFEHYLRWWTAKLRLAPSSSNGLQDLEKYLHHHVENTPGRKFLTTSFGSDWTEGYLREFMYCSRLQCQMN